MKIKSFTLQNNVELIPAEIVKDLEKLMALFDFHTKLDLNFLNRGWGNGYVVIPVGHPLYGMNMTALDKLVDAHGGITFARIIDEEMIQPAQSKLTEDDLGAWLIGFDTLHSHDNINTHNREFVEKETLRLEKQVKNFNVKPKL